MKVDAVKGCDDDGEEDLEGAEGGAGVRVPVSVCHDDRDHETF